MVSTLSMNVTRKQNNCWKPIQLNKADLKHFYDKTGPFTPQNTGSVVENSYQDNESNQAKQ